MPAKRALGEIQSHFHIWNLSLDWSYEKTGSMEKVSRNARCEKKKANWVILRKCFSIWSDLTLHVGWSQRIVSPFSVLTGIREMWLFMNLSNLTSKLLLLLLSHFSRVWLCATPSLGFSRQEYWSGLPFPSPLTSKRPFIILGEQDRKMWAGYQDS